MAKIDLDSLNIEELAALRERINEKLAEKVAARQAELEAELERLSQFGKPAKKAQGVPAAKPKKNAPLLERQQPTSDPDSAEAA